METRTGNKELVKQILEQKKKGEAQALDLVMGLATYYVEGLGTVSLADILEKKAQEVPSVLRTKHKRQAHRSETNIMSRFKKPPQARTLPGVVFNKTVVSLAQQNGIRMIEPKILTPPTEERVVTIQGKNYDVEEYPDFDAPVPQFTIPVYKPNYHTADANAELLNMVVATRMREEEKYKGLLPDYLNFEWLIEKLISVNNEYYYGNGSPAGQLGRMGQVKKIWDIALPRNPDVEPNDWYSPDKTKLFFQYLKDSLPVDRSVTNSNGDELDIGTDVELTYRTSIYESFVDLEDQGIRAFSITPTSMNGVLFEHSPSNYTDKGEALIANLVLSSEILNRISDILVGMELGEYTDDEVQNLINGGLVSLIKSEYAAAFLTVFKPKPEVYKRAFFTTKTRNINVVNECLNLPITLMVNPMMKKLKKPDLKTSNHLLHWSVFHGGMQDMILVSRRSKQVKKWAFADNVYFGWDKRVVSTDHAKMEACIYKRDVKDLGKFIVNEFWGNENVDDVLQFYLINIWKEVAVNAPTLLGNIQLSAPGMVSGVQGTGFINTSKTLRALFIMDYMFKEKNLFSEHIKEYYETDDWKEDPTAVPTFVEQAFLEIGITNETVNVLDLDYLFSSEADFKITVGDFLGFDVFKFNFRIPKKLKESKKFSVTDYPDHDLLIQDDNVTVFLPVLQEPRLFASLLFLKKKPESFPMGAFAFKWIVYSVLYTMGGWAYPALAESLKNYLSKLKTHLNAMDKKDLVFDAAVGDYFKQLTGLDTQEIDFQKILNEQRAIPTMSSVFSILMPPEYYELWVLCQQTEIFNLVDETEKYKQAINLLTKEQAAEVLDIDPEDFDIASDLDFALNKGTLYELIEGIPVQKKTETTSWMPGTSWADQSKPLTVPKKRKQVRPITTAQGTSTSAANWNNLSNEERDNQITAAFKALSKGGSTEITGFSQANPGEVVVSSADIPDPRSIRDPAGFALQVFASRASQKLGVNKNAVLKVIDTFGKSKAFKLKITQIDPEKVGKVMVTTKPPPRLKPEFKKKPIKAPKAPPKIEPKVKPKVVPKQPKAASKKWVPSATSTTLRPKPKAKVSAKAKLRPVIKF